MCVHFPRVHSLTLSICRDQLSQKPCGSDQSRLWVTTGLSERADLRSALRPGAVDNAAEWPV